MERLFTKLVKQTTVQYIIEDTSTKLFHPSQLRIGGSLLVEKSILSGVQEMKRLLFVFAKLNPGLRYVQGMNELLAPLYYQFRNDRDPKAQAHAEADSFYCFMDIIAEFRDHFCHQLVRNLSRLSKLTKACI